MAENAVQSATQVEIKLQPLQPRHSENGFFNSEVAAVTRDQNAIAHKSITRAKNNLIEW